MSICTTPMCSDGRAAVGKMWQTFNHLKSTDANFQFAHYEPTAIAIQAELETVDSWYADLIPFNPTCCTIQEIGMQADTLTNQMLLSVGASEVDIPAPPLQTDWTTLIFFGGIVLLALAYQPQVKSLFKGR